MFQELNIFTENSEIQIDIFYFIGKKNCFIM